MTHPVLAAAWQRALQTTPQWRAIEPMSARNVAAHGDSATWFAALDALPALVPSVVDVGPTIRIGRADDCADSVRAELRRCLRELQPWRKGPFALFGVDVDAEWRSDRKWARVAPHVALSEKRVLDVGCGNGYYGWRMCAAGARSVVGVDPTVVYSMQFAAIAKYFAAARSEFDNAVLPLRLEDLPDGDTSFDAVFSMGVLYHRRDPHEHLARLRSHLRHDGELVVETLIVADGSAEVLVPRERYARMRNVWSIPNVDRLLGWIARAGFHDARVVDVTATTTDEQRPTEWMRGESLEHGLDPRDRTRTIEGYPAPVRCVVVAHR